MPAAYMAAVFQHVGLPEVCSAAARRGSLALPHARESGRLVRDFLRDQGVAFADREHAAALIMHGTKPSGLPRSGAPASTYRKLSCVLDLRALYHLARAELAALGHTDDELTACLEAFRERAAALGVFGRPWPPPVAAEEVANAGFGDPLELHRALNAMRYFQLVARMEEPDWYAERLRLERERTRGRLHLLVGIAGSGKSTWAADNLAETVVISSDDMREELTGNPADQGQNYFVFQRCMDRVRTLLREGREVTFDATNYSSTLREMPVQAARWCGAEIASYFFDVAYAEAAIRNRRRPRLVPEQAIAKQCRLLTPPALYEADRHMVVDAEGKCTGYWPGP
jgi:predicted kinase